MTLKLDSSFKPIEMIAWQDAINLVITGKAFIVEAYEKFIRSAYQVWEMPAVIVLKRFVSFHHLKNYSCTRKNILLRDDYICQYCDTRFDVQQLTIDHIIPRSRGGNKTWTNLIAACRACNQKKGDKLPAEIGMFPINAPHRPGRLFLKKKFLKKMGAQAEKYI